MTSSGKWLFSIDRGGTFTDVIGWKPDGTLVARKLLSENPESYRDAAIQGMREILGVESNLPFPLNQVSEIRMGTTVATNALLERKGERTLLVITKGFRDALKLAWQARPDIFAKQIILPEQLYSRVIEVDERVLADGTVEKQVDMAALHRDFAAARTEGYDSVACVLMHSWAYPAHELAVETELKASGFSQISISHKVSPLIKLVSRGDTAVVDAYLSPILRRYVDQVASELSLTGAAGEPKLYFMMSSGGLTSADLFQGKDALLSGPAGGVVGMAETALMAGFDKTIGFDMGGTSTDVAHFDHEYERTFDTEVAGVRVRAPMMRIHTVAAGGGSILHYEDGRFRVGPDSAGANPGPASYRRGGPLTVTDANVMLGKLQPDLFPAIFGPARNEPLDAAIVREKFAVLAAQTGRLAEEVAEGFLTVAVENMANAVKKISVQRGYDVTGYLLNSFGGAGGQHACLVADALGMTRVLIHPMSGLLSAYGIGKATVFASRQKAILLPLIKANEQALKSVALDLSQAVIDELTGQGIAEDDTAWKPVLHIRYDGSDTTLPVNFATFDVTEAKTAFEAAHKSQFGFIYENRTLVVETIEVEGTGGALRGVDETKREGNGYEPEASEWRTVFTEGRTHKAAVHIREHLRHGATINGPALIIEPNQTIVIEPGWQAELTARDHIVLKRIEAKQRTGAVGTKADPVLLEVFNNLFMSIAEQMGVTLQNTAQSVNIKERLDFSCAVFDAEGHLVANAPHMPVHLGSMDRSVETIIRLNAGNMKPGDVFALNDPYNGGTHLPDITVVTPVFADLTSPLWGGRREAAGGGQPPQAANEKPSATPTPNPSPQGGGEQGAILFYVASRGHHADVGGTAPGSMTPLATTIEDEGVLIDNFHLVAEGRFREAELVALLTGHKWPVRNVGQNVADLKAQIAANEKGVAELRKMVAHFSLPTVIAYMGHVQDNAAESVRRVLARLPKESSCDYPTDTGQIIRVKVTVDHDRREATVDFTGTSPVMQNNFNAPEPVTRAAVLYAFRVMVEGNIPMNAGCLRPIRIIVPDGSMLKPAWPAAVVAGNVETSQHVTNALFMALGAMANAQGTMNNLTFGNAKYQYYETICSGSPAGRFNNGEGFDGTSGVHTHMTNSRLTDPEVLELRFPVVLEEFSIRQGSGGGGKFKGGDGTSRTIRFREKMDCAILSSHRNRPPQGLDGGGDGEPGSTQVRRMDGTIETLAACAQTVLEPDEAVIVTTPTPGGYGQVK